MGQRKAAEQRDWDAFEAAAARGLITSGGWGVPAATNYPSAIVDGIPNPNRVAALDASIQRVAVLDARIQRAVALLGCTGVMSGRGGRCWGVTDDMARWCHNCLVVAELLPGRNPRNRMGWGQVRDQVEVAGVQVRDITFIGDEGANSE